tara:strand:+ start:252 stop:1013 length:762 start_codon:yes stop_codon:yes gene_type:complete
MRDLSNWNVCLEVGINHLGSYSLLENVIKDSSIAELGVSITVQIKEEDFYKANKNFYLTLDEHRRFLELCRSMKIPCGLALGPLTDVQALKNGGLEPDFIKTLSISTEDINFIKRLYGAYDCPKYISVGLSATDYIKDEIIPLMNKNDMLIYTCLTHSSQDQNLPEIVALKEFGVPVCFGLHAIDKEIAFTAIGVGAEKIFVYIGNKKLDLPDYDHALDLAEIPQFTQKIDRCVGAMKHSKSKTKRVVIDFVK